MSFGLPASTEVNKVIPKKTIIDKFSLSGHERSKFDSTVHKITISNEISSRTVNISPKDVKSIFVLKVELREEKYDQRTIQMLFKMIDQNMIIILECGIRCKPIVFNDVLLEGEWQLESNFVIYLNGLDLDDVWNNIVIQIGNIEIESGNTLSEQIQIDKQHKEKEILIAQLTKKMMSEKQPKKKRELFEKIRSIQNEREIDDY